MLPIAPAPLYAGSDQPVSDLVPDGAGGAYDAFLIGAGKGENRLELAHIQR